MQTPELFLKRVLLIDAAMSALCAVLTLADAEWLASLTALPVSLLREAGIILLPFVGLVAVTATRAPLWQAGVKAVIAANVLWVLVSIVLALSGLLAPTAIGNALLIGQALMVAILAEAEFIGLRRLAALPA